MPTSGGPPSGGPSRAGPGPGRWSAPARTESAVPEALERAERVAVAPVVELDTPRAVGNPCLDVCPCIGLRRVVRSRGPAFSPGVDGFLQLLAVVEFSHPLDGCVSNVHSDGTVAL